jgi:alpha-amylase/alpha-mannosidase (GH57 family)
MANVVFLWHMHQPYYVDPATRTAMMPWVRLHCVKGYLDMVSVIEDFPGVRVNFNLTPVLMLQIRELIDGRISDLWLQWARKPASDLDERDKFSLLENFFKIHWDNLIKPFPRYWELLNKRGLTFYREEVRRGLRYFSTQEFLDLQTWFNLAWCGYSAERIYPELAALKRKGRGFSEDEKQRVLDIHLELMRLVIEKYRAAEERGQAELTTTPFFHPILPLVYDSSFAERSLSGRKFPRRYAWPQDAEAQLILAVEQHAAMFGRPPRGLWPSEGSIAPELIPLMEQCGIEYFCSDEENLFNSLSRNPGPAAPDRLELFQGWRVQHDGASVNALFREKLLSDFIGFVASKNDPHEAAAHLLHHMGQIAAQVPLDAGVIPLILDGENAWDGFSDGGQGFLRALYGGIAERRDTLHSCTIEDYFRHHPPSRQITSLHTGSWIASNFDLWIGDEEENAAWDLLGETRTFLQQRIDAGALSLAQQCAALREIYAAEGSDWFWWYGPDFSTENDALFDDLFRQHLRNVYLICDQVPPKALEVPLVRDGFLPAYEPPRHPITPEITGQRSAFFDWEGAGIYVAGSEPATLARADRCVDRILFGSDERMIYLRLDLAKWASIAIEVLFQKPAAVTVETGPIARRGAQDFTVARPNGYRVKHPTLAAHEVIEIAVPLGDLGIAPGAVETIAFQVRVLVDGAEHERYPARAPIQFTTPGAEFALENWSV